MVELLPFGSPKMPRKKEKRAKQPYQRLFVLELDSEAASGGVFSSGRAWKYLPACEGNS